MQLFTQKTFVCSVNSCTQAYSILALLYTASKRQMAFIKSLSKLLVSSWFQLFIDVFEAIKISQPTTIALYLMKLTACLERTLGNVSKITMLTWFTVLRNESTINFSNYVGWKKEWGRLWASWCPFCYLFTGRRVFTYCPSLIALELRDGEPFKKILKNHSITMG